jgi:hypothetical protein
MNNFTFELLTKCLINDAMVRGVEADVRGAAPAAAAPVILLTSAGLGAARRGGGCLKIKQNWIRLYICLRRFPNTEDSVE